MAGHPTLTAEPGLTPEDLTAVEELARAAPAADGHPPLNEAGYLRLQHAHAGVEHLLARNGDRITGYAQLEQPAAPDIGAAIAQLVVHPDARRQGVGTALLAALLDRSPSGLRVWAKGDSAAAAALAARFDLPRVRELLIMERSLTDLSDHPLPAGVTVRAFRPGQDEDAWLAVNARAFASHPEQGALTRADLAERMAEPWFDPEGFLLAERGGQLLGFHWTKQHSAELGEVYVLGVDPSAGGGGLGKALLTAGLQHLADRGMVRVQLYVEGDHDRAVGLYTAAGFTVVSRDVMYAASTNWARRPETSDSRRPSA